MNTAADEVAVGHSRWDIPDDWSWVAISEIGEISTGNTPPKKDPSNYGDFIPFVKPPELKDCSIRASKDGLSEKGMNRARTLPKGAVLVSCIGGLGKTGIAKVAVAFNQQINAIIFHERVLPEYGFYYAQTLKPWLYGVSSATTLPIVNKGKFQRAPFPLAPLDQQRRIVAEIEKQFSRLDKAVVSLNRVKANLKRYKAAVLKAAVEGKLTEEWRKQNPDVEPANKLLERILAERRAKWEEAELTKMNAKGKVPKNDKWKERLKAPSFDDSEAPFRLPDGWVWTTVDALLYAIEAGKSFKCEERPPDSSEIGVIKVSAVSWGEYLEQESKTCHDADRINAGLLINSGDFLFSRANTIELVGACVIVDAVDLNVMLSDKILRLGVISGVEKWLLFLLRSTYGRSEIERLATGNQDSMRNIGQARIRSIRVPLPPADELASIISMSEALVSRSGKVIDELKIVSTRAISFKQSVLKKSFSGGFC